MLSGLFPEQQRVLLDKARFKAIFCPRRAGKSWSLGTYLFLTALSHPGCSCLYLGLTRDSAEAIMDKDILQKLNADYELGGVWKDTKHRWELPNGSYIYLRGADANAYEMRKIVGQKYRLAVLDEAAKYRQDLEAMVYGALVPAMGDDLGTVILSGNPSNQTGTLFHRATASQEKGWSVHHWDWRANVVKRAALEAAHADLIDKKGADIVQTAWYKQEWLGEWVIDPSSLVYKFRESLNCAAELPRPKEEWTYVLGVDLGFTDPSALVVGAFHKHEKALYVVYAHVAAGLIISDVADLIKGLWYSPSQGLRGPYPFAAMVADASQLQGVEEMRQRCHVPLEAAQKAGKRGVIEVMNSELQSGLVKLLPAAMDVADDWRALPWDEKKLALVPPKWEEDPRFPNHAADACLYMWRKARNYDALPDTPAKPKRLTQEWHDEHMKREIARLERARQEGPFGVIVDEMPDWLERVGMSE